MKSSTRVKRILHALWATRVFFGPSFAALCLLGGTAAAYADEAALLAAGPTPSATESTTGRAEGLQEVVVTATRHEEALSKVPISVTALTQESMDQKGIKDFLDVARFTPGVSIDKASFGSERPPIKPNAPFAIRTSVEIEFCGPPAMSSSATRPSA